VGRRLAFDTEKGRLWVLCARCRSWNLAHLEERWEAVEEAERAFEGAMLGAGTELEVEWREAGALAAISDDLLVPAWVRRRIAEWRSGSGG
jgi:hypothetical protein